MMEPWPVSIEYQRTGLSQRLSVHSVERLNLVVTPAAFRSIGDARLFYSMMMSLTAPALAGLAPKALDAMREAPAPAKNMLSTMYRQDSLSRDVLIGNFIGCRASTCLLGCLFSPGCHQDCRPLAFRGSSAYSVCLRPCCRETSKHQRFRPLQAGQPLWAEAILLGRQW